MSGARHEGGGYETRDVAFRPVAFAAAGIVALIVTSFVAMWAFDRSLVAWRVAESGTPNPLAQAYGHREPPPPRLQSAPLRDLAELRAREHAMLEGYAWVDRTKGRVRIPVERAMGLLVEDARR
jgi:hypothetical protein